MINLINEMQSNGLIIDNPILDRAFHKCHTVSGDGKKNKSGWYIGFVDNDFIFCSYGDFRAGLKAKFNNKSELSLVSYSHDIIDISNIIKAKELEKQKEVAIKAKNDIEKAITVDSHDYLIMKGVDKYHKILQINDLLIVPMYNAVNNDLVGYQSIDKEGNKRFITGMKKKGSCFPILNENRMKTIKQDVLCICEGLATGLSIYQATGFNTIIAFDAYNLITVVKAFIEKSYENILICADNDHIKKDGSPRKDNPGIEAAKKINREYGLPYVYPTEIKGTDFNDLQSEKSLEDVRNIIVKGRVIEPYTVSDSMDKFHKDIKFCLENTNGILKDIANYYNKTAIAPQPLFALASGLILGSVLFGRRYNTGVYNNFSSEYILIIAKSGTGKDHVKQVIRMILMECNLEWLERGDGFTAANTIIKSLSKQALQLSFFEEIGQRLTECSLNNKSMAKGMFRKLLDVWSSCHSFVVGEEYADNDIPRCENPALTMVGLTTPKAFTDSITDSLIEQGFVNRLLPFISFQDRQATPLQKSNIKPPKKIIKWVQDHWLMGDLASAGMPIVPQKEHEITQPFSRDAITFLEEIHFEIVENAKILENINLDDMLSRIREHVMRVALIYSIFNDSDEINLQHVQWSYRLINALYGIYIDIIKRRVSGSDYEKWKLEALNYLRAISPKGIPKRLLPKTPPFSKWPKKVRDEILQDLSEANLISFEHVRNGKRGPKVSAWIAVNSD